MAGQEPDKHEKTEQATPFKLEEAKRKGSVVKSQEVNAVLALSAILLFVLALGAVIAERVLYFCRELLMSMSVVRHSMDPLLLMGPSFVGKGLMIVAPLAFVVLLVGIFSNVMQTGFVFSSHPLKPDFKRLNIVAGFKKFFSRKLMFEVFKTLIKFSLLVAVLYFSVIGDIEEMIKLLYQNPHDYLGLFIELGTGLLFKMLIALVFIAVLDFLFVRWDFLKNMMMTRKELKDEVKRRDGDPHIKSKRRELERELRKRAQSVSAVAGADVVVTNPTHFAVVIKYHRLTMRAPAVVGKGADKLALRIRREANLKNVPVIESPTLARYLFKKVSIDHTVPESTYVSVAKVLRKAFEMKKPNSQGVAV